MIKQFYRIGEHVTLRPWDRPNHEAVVAWWEDFQKTKYLDQFEVWICGGFLEGTKTWDVDIILTGDYRYPADLKHVLDEGIKIGFKRWLLVDIVWQDIINWQILHQTYNENTPFDKFKRIRNFNEVEKQMMDDYFFKEYNGVEIYPGLFQSEINEPPNSFKYSQKMFKEGKYKLGVQKLSDYIYNNKRTI